MNSLRQMAHAVAFVAIAGIGLACGDAAQEPVVDLRGVQADARISAEALAQAYLDSRSAADRSYKGNVVVVDGTVSSINLDPQRTRYVVFKTTPELTAQANLAETSVEQMQSVAVGQQLRLKCRVQGRIFNLILDNCILDESR